MNHATHAKLTIDDFVHPWQYATHITWVITAYIGFVVLLNTLFVLLPLSSAFGQPFSYAELAVGGIYVVRDFAQRAIGHYVIIAMIAAAVLTYVFADQTIAIASLSAFAVGECIDWAIYTFTGKTLSQRILWSSCTSSPIDSVIFLVQMGRFTYFEWAIMSVAKIVGAVALWGWWRIKRDRDRDRDRESEGKVKG